MILRALYDLAHAEKLVENPDYVRADVAYYLSLGKGGANPRLVSVMNERKEGKKSFLDLYEIEIPREPGRSGTKPPALFLLDKAAYLFGLGPGKGKESGLRSFPDEFERFRERTRAILPRIPERSIEREALSALLAFLDGPESSRHQLFRDAYDAAQTKERAHLLSRLIYVIFAPEGVTPLHLMPAIRKHWHDERERERAAGTIARCLITGEIGPQADRHTFVKGIPKASTSGVPLVSFNESAFESYGLIRNHNAPVGQAAAEAYATALNRLVDNDPKDGSGNALPRQNVKLSADTIAVFWSSDASSLPWLSLLADTPESVKAMLHSPLAGRPAPLDDPSTFFTLILSGGQGRATVRSFLTRTTREVAANVDKYLDNTCIVRPYEEAAGTYPLRDLMRSLAPLGDDERLPPHLATEIYLAAISGRRFPHIVLEAAVRRNRIEGPDGKPFAARCSLIRASLIRNESFKEEPTVSLDLNNRQPPYLLGRLLAVVDHIQQDALGSVNASLVDRYYGSASSTPAVVFPTLLRRSQHHLSKLRKEKGGLAVVREKVLQETMNGLEKFPRTLTLEAQGLFALGFHHQRQAFFMKSNPDKNSN